MATKALKKQTVTGSNGRFCQSTFTLTFAVEVPGLEVWEDCKEGRLELGPYVQGLKLQCQLYPGQNYDLDIVVWPHVAKIFCGNEYGWVRVWQFLESRWLAFSVRFAFAVRVLDMRSFEATIIPSFGVASLGSNAKNDKSSEVLLPPLGFGVRRYFGLVLEHEETMAEYVQELIRTLMKQFITWSCFDGLYEVPGLVTDARHQDTCLDNVRDLMLRRLEPLDLDEEIPETVQAPSKDTKSKTAPKEKEKKKSTDKLGFCLSGESILAGTGRIVSFETAGELPPDSPQIIVLISSNNLPAQDDLPIVFLNVGNLCQIPINELKILRVTHLYIKWQVGEEVNCSEPKPLKSKEVINFNNHRALPIPFELLPKTLAQFLDTCFKIELRGIRLPSVTKRALLFGYEKGDHTFGRSVPKPPNEELDFSIATTKIEAKSLAKGINSFLSGEYPLYPQQAQVQPLERESFCTNDINHIRMPIQPDLIVQPFTVLEAQMSLEVSMGVVGCKTRKLSECFSRIFCLISDPDAVMVILRCIQEINEDILLLERKPVFLSGFALDTGNIVILYVEGPRECHILRIFEMTEDFYPKVKPVFSCSDRYSTRIYPELLTTAVPFIVLKMHIPLGVILACPPIYARPALPLPTRSAVLKFGRLVVCNTRTFPSRCQMPTTSELMSFKLELCVAARPTPVVISDNITVQEDTIPTTRPFQQRINWNNK